MKTATIWGGIPAAITSLIPLDERFHYPKSLLRVLNQERFTVAINRDFKAVVTGCGQGFNLDFTKLQEIYWELYQTGWAYSLKLGRATASWGIFRMYGGAFIGNRCFTIGRIESNDGEVSGKIERQFLSRRPNDESPSRAVWSLQGERELQSLQRRCSLFKFCALVVRLYYGFVFLRSVTKVRLDHSPKSL